METLKEQSIRKYNNLIEKVMKYEAVGFPFNDLISDLDKYNIFIMSDSCPYCRVHEFDGKLFCQLCTLNDRVMWNVWKDNFFTLVPDPCCSGKWSHIQKSKNYQDLKNNLREVRDYIEKHG